MRKIAIITITVMTLFLTLNVEASTQTPQTTTQYFKDIDSNYIYAKEIKYLISLGVLNINEQKNLSPNRSATRYDILEFLGYALNYELTLEDTNFKDVPRNLYISGFVNQAVKDGIVNGYPDGTFRGSDLVTRGQTAALISRAFQLSKESNVMFKDVSTKSSYFKYVRQLHAAGITTGYADNTFKPQNNVTRIQVLLFIARALGYNDYLKNVDERDFEIITIDHKQDVYIIIDRNHQASIINVGNKADEIVEQLKKRHISRVRVLTITSDDLSRNSDFSKLLNYEKFSIAFLALPGNLSGYSSNISTKLREIKSEWLEHQARKAIIKFSLDDYTNKQFRLTELLYIKSIGYHDEMSFIIGLYDDTDYKNLILSKTNSVTFYNNYTDELFNIDKNLLPSIDGVIHTIPAGDPNLEHGVKRTSIVGYSNTIILDQKTIENNFDLNLLLTKPSTIYLEDSTNPSIKGTPLKNGTTIKLKNGKVK